MMSEVMTWKTIPLFGGGLAFACTIHLLQILISLRFKGLSVESG